MDEADGLLPASKRRRVDETNRAEARVHDDDDQQEVIPDSDGEQDQEIPLTGLKTGQTQNDSLDAAGDDESMALLEADKSLPHHEEEEEDEFDAIYKELEWDGVLAVDVDNAARQIFSPSQIRPQSTSHQPPSSSPLKPSDARARSETVAREIPFSSQPQHPLSSQSEEEEARIRAQEEAMLAKYRNLDYLTKFNAQNPGFDSPAPGGNVTFASAGFTSVRGKRYVPSEEALAKASRFAQFSPEAAKDGSDEAATLAKADSTETPTLQRSRSSHQLPMQLAQHSGALNNTASHIPREAAVNPLQPLRYGPKKGHSLLPNRLPSVTTRQAETSVKTMHSHPEQSKSSFVGFTSGSGAQVTMPTKEQAEKHLRALEGDDDDPHMHVQVAGLPSSSPPEACPGLSFAGGGAFKMPSKALLDQEVAKMLVDSPESALTKDPKQNATTSNDINGSPNPLLASGKAVAMPSAEQMTEALRDRDSVNYQASVKADLVQFGGFTTGGGRSVAMPSEEQVRVATEKLDQPTEAVRPTTRASTSFAGLMNGGGKPVAGPSAEAIRATTARLDKSSTIGEGAQGGMISTPERAALASKAVNVLSRSNLGSSTPGTQPFSRASTPIPPLRKPFKVPTANSVKGTSTPGRPANSQLGGGMQPRRLNLEMTPRNTPKSALNRSTFKTPFKNGQRPDPKMLEKLKADSNIKMVTPGKSVDVVVPSQSSGIPVKEVTGPGGKAEYKAVANSVFDLYTKAPRKSMAAYGFDLHTSVDHLIDCRIPTDVIFMTYHKAEAYKFRGEFGFEAAFEDLVYYCDCRNVTMDWVKNHWKLIMWKTAAMIRAMPDECPGWWTFQRMVDQLKYRYEKEVICGQRSCIKRIQERDSSAWLPMILVVTEIIHEEREVPPEPGSDEERQGITRREMVPVALVLSDGWYRIRTSGLDDALYRAIAFRSIYPGMKMRIQGAKLDSGSDGADPLEAFATSTLVVSGNSTSRAAWYEKLGFQKRPYICAFSSLLPDGGLVPFIDIIITRLYPLGYKGPYVEGENPDLWDEAEEKARQRKWESDRENALTDIRISQQTAYGRLAKLQCLMTTTLRVPSNRIEVVKDQDPGLRDFQDVYDRIEEEPDKAPGIIRRLSREVLEDLAAFVKRKIEALSVDGGHDFEKELEARCPPRVAKAFRIIRVKDARVSDSNAARDCQLNINDVLNLGPDFLSEGKRYLVSNVYPGRLTSWSAPKAINGEIFLSTRFDSKWQVLPHL